MKKTFKILAAMLRIAIIALFVTIGFSMAACKNDSDDPNQPKQFLKVEGIPKTYKNMYGIILLTPPNSSDITIYSALEKINDTSISFPLYIWEDDDPWEGSGSFCVKILIFKNAESEDRVYQGVTTKTKITDNTVIKWSSFTEK